MPATFDAIANVDITGSTTNAITFSSIPATYTDLRVVIFGKGGSNAGLYTFNNSGLATTLYNSKNINGTPGLDSNRYLTYGYYLGAASISWSSTYWGVTVFDIFNYASASHKPILWQKYQPQNSSTAGGQELWSGLWRSPAAINRIDFQMGTSGYWAVGTYATLYGITKA